MSFALLRTLGPLFPLRGGGGGESPKELLLPPCQSYVGRNREARAWVYICVCIYIYICVDVYTPMLQTSTPAFKHILACSIETSEQCHQCSYTDFILSQGQ